jgi:hypothetical protein
VRATPHFPTSPSPLNEFVDFKDVSRGIGLDWASASNFTFHAASMVDDYIQADAVIYRTVDRVTVITTSALVRTKSQRFFNGASTC